MNIYHALKCCGSNLFASFCLSFVQHFAQRSSYAAITLIEVELKQSVTRNQDVNSTPNETKTACFTAHELRVRG